MKLTIRQNKYYYYYKLKHLFTKNPVSIVKFLLYWKMWSFFPAASLFFSMDPWLMFVLGFVSFLALTLKVLIDKYTIHSYQIYKKPLYAFCSLLLLLINLIFLPYFYFCLMTSFTFIFMYILDTVKGIWIFEAENLDNFY